ncbi:DUF485 domain-containing protein [Desulfurispira natronophila]|uniref:Uncharacterized membrane protein (DUF485 family) n=1 Tax=Desulfurispira natronophila TaxID=682562 RepID=A0A7W7Y4W3_9BACT|nr:DUF485 domain-containing protein [Desulfurispira natronophila]MBB5022146.1 uncharacterized membrane protein (DUF485 family) [Desulfurispira natronophila]
MGHGPAVKLGKDNASPYKAKLGIKLFWFYALLYMGFVVINLNWPTLMATHMLGMNFALAYGLGLIIIAMIMAFIYNHMCTKAEREMNKEEEALG